MSYIVKGAFAPNICKWCHLKRTAYEEGKPIDVCIITREKVNQLQLPDGCPIENIKVPHGRLIDADLLLKDLRDLYAEKKWDWSEIHFSLNDVEMNLCGRTIIKPEGEEEG